MGAYQRTIPLDTYPHRGARRHPDCCCSYYNYHIPLPLLLPLLHINYTLFQKEKSRADLLEKDVKIKELEKQVLEQMLELQTK